MTWVGKASQQIAAMLNRRLKVEVARTRARTHTLTKPLISLTKPVISNVASTLFFLKTEVAHTHDTHAHAPLTYTNSLLKTFEEGQIKVED